MRFKRLFNITEIAAVLEGIPNNMKSDVWFKNFYDGFSGHEFMFLIYSKYV